MTPGALLLAAVLWYQDDDRILLLALAACAVHELGHYLALRLVGGRVARLRITWAGAEMRLSVRCPLSPPRQLAAALAGPAANLLTVPAACALGGEGGFCLAGLSMALGVFNLLPAAPLDGGRALCCLLAPALGQERAEQGVQALSLVLAGALLGLSGVLVWRGMGNLTLLLTSGWLAGLILSRHAEKKGKFPLAIGEWL